MLKRLLLFAVAFGWSATTALWSQEKPTSGSQLAPPVCLQTIGVGQPLYCPTLLVPVCGCNGATYNNECEAQAAGVTTWWAGDCNSQPSAATCGSTDFTLAVIDGAPDQGFSVQFDNLAQGAFDRVQIDFGDGTPVYEGEIWANVTHYYANPGIYRATLTAWKTDDVYCVSSVAKTFATDAASLSSADIPSYADYVLPGDANGDQRANLYDLFQLGLGYGTSGSPRPEASTNWVPQFAPNWQNNVPANGVNFKHLDCNGDGQINELDAAPLATNYQPAAYFNPPIVDESLPQFWLSFDQDTLLVDPANPQEAQISVNLNVGSATQEVDNLYGVAFTLNYPELVGHNPNLVFEETLLGAPSEVLTLNQDRHAAQQLDLALVRKSGIAVSGHGKVATLRMRGDYIIIIDIIDRAESKAVPFTLPVEGLRAIDGQGNPVLLGTPSEQDTLWIKLVDNASSTNEQALNEQKVRLFPNPVADVTTLQTGDLNVTSIEVLNGLGQVVTQRQGTGERNTQLDVSAWQSGVYVVRVRTDRGVFERRLLVK